MKKVRNPSAVLRITGESGEHQQNGKQKCKYINKSKKPGRVEQQTNIEQTRINNRKLMTF